MRASFLLMYCTPHNVCIFEQCIKHFWKLIWWLTLFPRRMTNKLLSVRHKYLNARYKISTHISLFSDTYLSFSHSWHVGVRMEKFSQTNEYYLLKRINFWFELWRASSEWFYQLPTEQENWFFQLSRYSREMAESKLVVKFHLFHRWRNTQKKCLRVSTALNGAQSIQLCVNWPGAIL